MARARSAACASGMRLATMGESITLRPTPQRAQPQFVVAQLGVGHHDGAAVDLLQPIHAAQQRALARAALADDGDDLAGFDA
ncbi:hypothetical protein G6F31_020735 [Rhizopus arrhizus]|nr:hypothetical protein G6F31_020735 [Rhizopus arrhizus]